MRRFGRRFAAWSYERWINFLLFFFVWVVLLLLILDGVFFILFQASLDMMARRIVTYAATVQVSHAEAGLAPDQLAMVRCRKAYEYFKDGTPNGKKFLGYTKETRERFLDELQLGAKPESVIDRTVHSAGIGNGCYYKYDSVAAQLVLYTIIEGRKTTNPKDGIWPVFARGILGFFGKNPVTLYGRASYSGEGVATGKHAYHPLEHKIGRSLKAYGLSIASMETAGGGSTVKIGDVAGGSGTVVGDGDITSKTLGGKTFGLKKINVHDPSGQNLPLMITSLVYKWSAEIPWYCDYLAPSSWDRKTAPSNEFRWKLNANEFLDINQSMFNLLPCWNGQCDAMFINPQDKSGRYAYNKSFNQYHLPLGVSKTATTKKENVKTYVEGGVTYSCNLCTAYDEETEYYARATNLDGNNHPITLKQGGSGETSENIEFLCAFSRDEALKQQAKGNGKDSAIIKTVIDSPSPTPGLPPINKPLRPCDLGYGIGAQGDIGPYQELQSGSSCKKPTENWGEIERLHKEEQRYQNPLDRYIPYYKYADTCPTGTPHCGYFGTNNIRSFATEPFKEWWYKYDNSKELGPPVTNACGDIGYAIKSNGVVPEIKFSFKARLLSNSSFARQQHKVDLECSYKRHTIHQHCCRGTNESFCQGALEQPNYLRRSCKVELWRFSCHCSWFCCPHLGWHDFLYTTDLFHIRPEPKDYNDLLRDKVFNRGALKLNSCCEARCDNDNSCSTNDKTARDFPIDDGILTSPCKFLGDDIGWPFRTTYLEPFPESVPLIYENCNDNDNESRKDQRCQVF